MQIFFKINLIFNSIFSDIMPKKFLLQPSHCCEASKYQLIVLAEQYKGMIEQKLILCKNLKIFENIVDIFLRFIFFHF